MAIRQTVFFANKNAPATGLTPVVLTYIYQDGSGSAGTAPTITELSGGLYYFDHAVTKQVVIVIDGGSSLPDGDRIVAGEIGPDDEFAADNMALINSGGYRCNTRIGVYAAGGAERQVIYSGTTPTFSFTIVDEDGAARDLTDYTVYLTGKALVDDTAVVIDRQCTITDAAAGICEVTLSASDTISAGEYVCEVSLTDGSDIQVAAQFALKIAQAVRDYS